MGGLEVLNCKHPSYLQLKETRCKSNGCVHSCLAIPFHSCIRTVCDEYSGQSCGTFFFVSSMNRLRLVHDLGPGIPRPVVHGSKKGAFCHSKERTFKDFAGIAAEESGERLNRLRSTLLAVHVGRLRKEARKTAAKGGDQSLNNSASRLRDGPGIATQFNNRNGAERTSRTGCEEEGAWTVADSSMLYRVAGWGAPYFGINSTGNVCVHPLGGGDQADELDIVDLIGALLKRNVQLPMVIRFPDIVQHRIQQLQDCFNSAISKFGYQRHFQGVFPVKCNHDRHLLEDIVEFGRQCRFGLEAGSKAELLIAIANLRGKQDALLICNGYKDQVYIESVLLSRQLGVNGVIVLEQMEELDLVIDVSKKLRIRPLIGVRAKLSVRHDGHWGETSGDRGKFGLTTNEIVRVVYRLKQEGMLDCLQLLHFHIGSQVPSISIIKDAMREASHMYCELALLGAAMGYIDVGGGLGIDYDGTKGRSEASTNYSMQNYANDVVAALSDACLLKQVAQPVIISESGRALASHHSVLVFDVLNASQRSEAAALENLSNLVRCAGIGEARSQSGTGENSGPTQRGVIDGTQTTAGDYLLSTFFEVYDTMDEFNFQEAYNDAKQFKSEAWSLFKLGCLSLEQRAQADALYDAVCHRAVKYSRGTELPDELQAVSKSFAAVYHVNMSVFRSAPDSWAISQLFPVMPLQRLNEKPGVQATLADLTCDSDGKINRFIGANGESTSVLPVHELVKGELYYFGLFLGGVYQEVMGSSHNLFGMTNVVHVRAKRHNNGNDLSSTHKNGEYIVEHVIRGQTMEELLQTVQHVGEDMMEALRRETENAVASGCLTIEEAQRLLINYRRSLGSYTYLTR